MLALISRSRTTKLTTFAFLAFVLIASYSLFRSPTASLSALFAPRIRSQCAPRDWANGAWTRRPHPLTNKTAMSQPADAIEFAGFHSCASDREFFWHLGADAPEQWDRWPDVTSYEWTPPSSCNIRPFDRDALVRDLVERGGWLLIGDSVTENHFFSLSCLLAPHVTASPNYTLNPYYDRAWPQHLHLSPSSPLLPTLSPPPGFNATRTPLITFRRVDLLLSQPDLVALHRELHKPPQDFRLFSDEQAWSLPVAEYMELFQRPLPDANYAALVVSTAGHWTTSLFSGLRDDSQSDARGKGIERVLRLFGAAMERWAREVQGAMDGDRGTPGERGVERRRVLVRAYLSGHDKCRSERAPWSEERSLRGEGGPYNWPWIGEFNGVFEEVLVRTGVRDVSFLGVDRPGMLRPDAHAAGDCLHIMTGAGVLEGWTHYIWHYLTREVGGGVR